ncbi:uncharacterized protein LOC125568254 isoform X2 [Nematostella vectensis]|uniref:uncharacterized protein LOC125568254 isoform X2 n=1 Tax=Nematostella vectensis TaxID=45351 RepID=UPI0020778642|nr:uncharacterized protein LOC125568254 isoform X2 [Nematostella vectensis]
MIYCRVYDMSSPERDSITCTDELQVFALLSLHESPRKLISQVIVFAVGDWDKHVESNCIVTEVSLESEQLPKRIGILTKENKALCWQAEWGKNFINRSLELLKEDRMAKLTVTIQKKDLQKENQKLAQKVFSTKTSPKTLFSKTSKQGTPGGKTKTSGVLQPRNKNVKLDELWATNGKETKPDTTTTTETYVVTTSVSERKKRTPNGIIKT